MRDTQTTTTMTLVKAVLRAVVAVASYFLHLKNKLLHLLLFFFFKFEPVVILLATYCRLASFGISLIHLTNWDSTTKPPIGFSNNYNKQPDPAQLSSSSASQVSCKAQQFKLPRRSHTDSRLPLAACTLVVHIKS